MQSILCNTGCCELLKRNMFQTQRNKRHRRCKKAGALIYDEKRNKVLLVQSRCNFWGIPKGSVKDSETSTQCAIREVNEETSVILVPEDLTMSVTIRDSATYFFVLKSECNVSIKDDIIDNDVNALGWIRLECLKEMIQERKLILNQHTRTVLQKFLNFSFD
jgi:8-oxo-dGTP pyrophosphatase MutT (NUDIX family)